MKNLDEFVFHFTSAGAALSILTRRQLWATDIEYLNDKFEGQLPSKVIGWIVDRPESFLPGIAAKEKHFASLRQSLNHGLVACTISFSQHYRSLPQFRMYCPPAGGYAVGFPKEFLERIGMFIQCDYSNSRLHDWCRDYARRFLLDAAALDDESIDANALCIRVIQSKPYIQDRVVAALTFKSEEFINELEYRLVAFGLPKEFRESPDRNLIIPFSKIDLPNDVVDVRLVPGPNREPDLASRSIGNLSRAAREAGTVWSVGHLSPGEFGFRA